VSNLYSTGEYLDRIIEKISDYAFEQSIKRFEQELQRTVQALGQRLTTVTRPNPDSSASSAEQEHEQVVIGPIKLDMPPPWKALLDEITLKYEPIYHSNITAKLKKIAGRH